ncbi:MAG: DUF5691 domain-containing protein [Chloroflexia bacterium]
MPTWTQEQIISLAPDPASAKAGRELASPRKWQNAGHNEHALWGEHQGSGSKPYFTSIDLEEPAFKCTCPSRKFPCKHGLGLFLAFTNEPAAFPAATPPQWAAEWLTSRVEKEERDAKREERKEQEANDPEAKAKAEKAAARSASQRKSRVDKGIEDLDRWLCDLIHAGFSASNLNSYSLWESQAARLVDAQAPGLARMVRNMGDLATSSATDAIRNERILEEAGRVHLIIQAYSRLENLPPAIQDEIRTLVGWTQDQADLIASAPNLPDTHRTRDNWFVARQLVTEDDKLRSQSTWLWSNSQPRAALIMDFAYGNAPLDKSLVVGTQIDAELVYFPGAYPVRAIVKERFGSPTDLTNLEVWTIEEALAKYHQALQQNPLLNRFPMFLCDVVPIYTPDKSGDLTLTYVRNVEGDTLPVNPATNSQEALGYLALSGGDPIMIFGLWNGKHLTPLNGWVNTLDLDAQTHKPGGDTRNAGEVEPAIWDALLTSALLGTERRPPNIPATDGPLGAILSVIRESTADNPAQGLLAAASTLTIYRQAGKLPAHDATPLPEPSPPETLSPIASGAAHYLHSMISGNNGGAIVEWLEAAAVLKKHVPDYLLIALLDIGQGQPTYRPAILPVLGNRGRWLAQQYASTDKWAYVRDATAIETPGEESTMELWETGSLEARYTVLRNMRQTQPDQARELLASVWKQENAKTRNYLLEVLSLNTSMSDEPFLESLLDDRSSEVRSTAADCLSRLPGSRLMQRTIDRTSPLLSFVRLKQGKLFGKSANKDHIAVLLPEEYTPAMKRDAIDQKPPNTRIGERAFWLVQHLSRIPPRVWAERWGAEPSEIIAAAFQTKDWKDILVQSWLLAAIRHNDQLWAESYMAQGFTKISEYSSQQLIGNALNQVISMLPPERRDQLVISTLNAHPEALYTKDMPLDLLWTFQKPWSIELSRAVLKSVAHHIKNNTLKNGSWQVSQSMSAFAFSMPASLLAEAERALIINDTTPPQFKDAIEDFITTLKFRQDMLTALAQ